MTGVWSSATASMQTTIHALLCWCDKEFVSPPCAYSSTSRNTEMPESERWSCRLMAAACAVQDEPTKVR